MSRIPMAAFFAFAFVFLFAIPAFGQTQGSSALDTDCLLPSYDFSCKVGGTDKQGKPCGQGLPVASTQVKGICIANGKAQETSYENQDGQWVSGPQPNSQATAAQTATGISGGAAAQVTPASVISAPVQTTGAEPQTQVTPQTSNALVPGTSVLDNSLQLLTGQENAAPPGGASNISPSDNENTIFNPQPLSEQPILPGGEAQAFTSEPPPTPATGVAANPDYQPAASTFSQTVAQPMGSLSGMTPEEVQSANTLTANSNDEASSASNPYLADQRAALMDPLDPNSPNYDPNLRTTVAAVLQNEIDTPEGQQAVLESMVNRSILNGYGSLYDAINSGFYGPVNDGSVAADINSGNISADQYAMTDQVVQAVSDGSNICNYCTDQGMADEIQGAKWNIGGEYFGYMSGSAAWSNQQQAAEVAYNANYSGGTLATAAVSYDPWAGSQANINDVVSPNLASINTYASYATLAPEPLSAYPVASVEVGSQLTEPTVPVEPNAEPYPTVAVQTGPALPEPAVPVEPNAAPYPTVPVASAPLPLSNEQIASYVPVPETFATNPQLAIEQANNEAINQQLPTPELVDTNPQAAIEQANNEALNQQLPIPSPVQTNPQAAIEQANNEALNQQLPTPQSVETNPQLAIEQQLAYQDRLALADQQTAAYQSALQNASLQVPLPEQVQITPEQIAAEVAQTNPAVYDEGLAFSPPGNQNNWANPSENEAFAYQGSQPSVEATPAPAPIIPAEAYDFTYPPAPDQTDWSKLEFNDAFGSNPNEGSPALVTATCSGGGGVCGQDNTTAAPGGAPLTGETDAVAVPKDNPYGLKIGDTVSVQVGGTVVQNVPVTDYTQTGSGNYVVSGALENQLGGTGSDAALITPTPAPQPLPGSAPAGQGGIGSDYVSSQITPAETVAAPGTPPEVLQSAQPLSAADLFPGENAAAWSEVALNDQAYNPSQNESLAYGGEQAPASASTQEQTGSVPAAAASDIASANPSNDERLQPAQDQSEPQTPVQTPMQQEAQRTQNAFNASYSAYKAFVSNPTDQTLQNLINKAQQASVIGGQFNNTTVQQVASQIGGFQQAQGYSPSTVASYLSQYESQITGGLQQVQQVLSRYLH